MGESWLLQLELDGALNEQGMVCDFGIVKKLTREWMDKTIDHALLVPTRMDNLKVEQAVGQTRVEWVYPDGQAFNCLSPSKAIALIDVEEITPESMAEWCRAQLIELIPLMLLQTMTVMIKVTINLFGNKAQIEPFYFLGK